MNTDSRGQSEIIGVILLIAITLVLASLVAVYAFDLGQTTQDAPPQATFSFDQAADGDLTATHEGGQALNPQHIQIIVNDFDDGENDAAAAVGETATDGAVTRANWPGTERIRIGTSEVVATDVYENDVVRIVYVSPRTGQETTLGRFAG